MTVARLDPAWYTPADLPSEVLAFDARVRGGLGVGAAGKVGLLDITLGRSGGATRIRRQYQRAPLHVYRPVYLDRARPDMAFVYVQQSGDGLVQGDRYRIDVDCEPGSAVHLTTQTPTKVFGARDNFATQLVNLRAGAGAVVEYLPDPVVPFRGSRLFQRTCVTADPTATVLLGETVLPGRVAHDEAHVYDVVWAETEVRRPDGRLVLTDTLRLAPSADVHPRSAGVLGPFDTVSTLYVLCRESAGLVETVRTALAGCAGLAGVSELPGGSGVVVRVLAESGTRAQRAMRVAWETVRLTLLGIPAPDLRKS